MEKMLSCPICFFPPGHDHRRCFFLGLEEGLWKSSQEWVAPKAAAKPKAAAPAAVAAAAPPPSSAPVAAVAAAAPVKKCSVCRQPGHTKKTCKGVAAPAAAAAAAPAPQPADGPADLEWNKLGGLKQTFPPGIYYLSDICYSMDDKLYDELWGKQHNYNTGFYSNGKDHFAVFHTAYGDGCYKGSDGESYGVDAGVIGIVSERLFKAEGPYGGTRIEAEGPVTFRSDDRGHFWCSWDGEEIYINTEGGDEDEDEDEDEDRY
jgi:hypothetical protein